MNYQKIYEQLIRFRQNNPAKKDPAVCQHFTEVEVHHIVPRSFGGSDDPSNLVELTLREHFVAHRLLYFQAKADGNEEFANKMICAIWFFVTARDGSKLPKNSRKYEKVRAAFIQCQRNCRMISDGKTFRKIKKTIPIPEGWSECYPITGRIAIHNGLSIKFIEKSDTIEKGWELGSGQVTRGSSGFMWIHKGSEEKFVPGDSKLEPGWTIGHSPDTTIKTSKGRTAINNGKIHKYVDLSKTEIPKGWTVGAMPTNNTALVGSTWITNENGSEEQYHPPGLPIPDGWHVGRSNASLEMLRSHGQHAEFHGKQMSFSEIAKACHIDCPTFYRLLSEGFTIDQIEQRQNDRQKKYEYNGKQFRISPLLKALHMTTGGRIKTRMVELLESGHSPEDARNIVREEERIRKSKQFANSQFVTNGSIKKRISVGEPIPEGFWPAKRKR